MTARVREIAQAGGRDRASPRLPRPYLVQITIRLEGLKTA
jgi:hypothetical protein